MSVSPLSEVLQFVSAHYDKNHASGYDQPAQETLDSAPEKLKSYVPIGFEVGSSGQKNFRLPATPWIGFRNPDVAPSFQQGIYVVYLFDAHLKTVYLSLNQGTEDLKKKFGLGEKEQIETLHVRARMIRDLMPDAEKSGTLAQIDLKSDLQRPASYEAGNILALEYSISAFPPEQTLVSDLQRFVKLYDRALQISNKLSMEERTGFVGVHNAPNAPEVAGLAGFNPKSDSDYVTEISACTIVKTRRHEKIVRMFGPYAATRGFHPSTPHPVDVLLSRDGTNWLIEVKVVYDLNYAEAVRAAIGQLLEYRHFLHPSAHLIALFDKPVGDGYVGFLRNLGISVIWLSGDKWSVSSDDHMVTLLAT